MEVLEFLDDAGLMVVSSQSTGFDEFLVLTQRCQILYYFTRSDVDHDKITKLRDIPSGKGSFEG